MIQSHKVKSLLVLGGPVILAGLVKVLIWSPEVTPFNADEAVVALMARHITQGELMLFFYGQYYMGSLDAILISMLYRFFGESIGAIRFLQAILYLGTVFTTTLLAKRILRSEKGAFFAGMLAALPPVNVALYTTVSLGGYGELLLIGNLLLLGGIDLLEKAGEDSFSPGMSHYIRLVLWSLGAGFAFWVIGLSLVYSLPVILIYFWRIRNRAWKIILRSFWAILLGGLVGSSPWWGAAVLAQNLAVVSELSGSAIAGASQGIRLLQPLKRMLNLVIFGGTVITGLRPPWGVRWLMLPLLPFVLIFWMAVMVDTIRKLLQGKSELLALPALMGLVLSLGFIFSPYGDDPSGRYFLPLIIPMAVFAAETIRTQLADRPVWQAGLLLLVLAFNLGGIVQSRAENPPGLTTQFDPVAQIDHTYLGELVSFLEEEGIKTGYSNYWVAYPVAFLTGEEIILSPRLPYHLDFRYTARDDRYPLYTELVKASEATAYITTNHPPLNAFLENQFSGLGIAWEEKTIGDYTVYYHLAEPVHVDQIGLGETTQP